VFAVPRGGAKTSRLLTLFLISSFVHSNYSFTPALKNALDWGSRVKGNEAFKGKAASLISVGGGLKGGRSQYHLRQVCIFLDLYVLNKPEILMNAFDGSFDKDGTLQDAKWQNRLLEQLQALKDLSLKLNPVESASEL
jgi:chromate reductase